MSNQLERQWRIIRILCSRRYGASLQDLVNETGMSVKTIRRDLKTFEDAEFPLEVSVRAHGKKMWKMKSVQETPGLKFAFDEAIALYMGRRFFEPLAGTNFYRAAHSAFNKIRDSLNETALEYIDKMASRIYFPVIGASNYAPKADMLDDLAVAVEDGAMTMLDYHSLRSTEPVVYEVQPLGFVYHKHSLYLVAFSTDHGEIRRFKFDRVHGVERTELHFKRPAGFDLQKHFADSFGVFMGDADIDVTVRFLAPVVRYVQESDAWHHSQQLVPQPDGTLLAHFHLNSLEELKIWLLGFGRHAAVLEPPEFRDAMRDEAEAMLKSYQPKPTKRRKRSAKSQ